MFNSDAIKQDDEQQLKRNQHLLQNWLEILFTRHVHACLASLGRLSRAPVSSIMTIAVIGISLALPMGLYLILESARFVSHEWDNSTRVSIFLKKDMSDDAILDLTHQLRLNDKIADLKLITPEQGLTEFQQAAGFGDLIHALPDNPLPPVIEIQPSLAVQNTQVLQQLLDELSMNANVELAQLDVEWVQRLMAIVQVARQGFYAIALLLALGVILVVGNTIRLAIQNYRDEIEIIKLVGANDGFVRRPFLYTGFFYGAFGGISAWLCVDFLLLWLEGPINELVNLYDAPFHFSDLGINSVFILITSGALLGLIGALISVNHHLRRLDPI